MLIFNIGLTVSPKLGRIIEWQRFEPDRSFFKKRKGFYFDHRGKKWITTLGSVYIAIIHFRNHIWRQRHPSTNFGVWSCIDICQRIKWILPKYWKILLRQIRRLGHWSQSKQGNQNKTYLFLVTFHCKILYNFIPDLLKQKNSEGTGVK